MAESQTFRYDKDPAKALDYFRSLPPEEQIAAAMAEMAILRYELRLGEEIIIEERRTASSFRKLFAVLGVLVVVGIGLSLLAHRTSLDNQKVLQDCTDPAGECAQRSRQGTAELVYRLNIENDCRTRRALAGLEPPPVALNVLQATPCVFPTPEQEAAR